MAIERTAAEGLRRLRLSHTLAWALAWATGVVTLAIIASGLSTRLHLQDLDAELALYATATYGLTYFDESGTFHDEIFRREADLVEGPADIWVVEPGAGHTDPGLSHLRPSRPRFAITDLAQIAARVVASDDELILDGHDASGRAFRLYAIPTYQDDDQARAAVIVAASPIPGRRAHRAFVRKLLLAAALLGLLGIPAGAWLASWSLRPIRQGLRQRERFLAAAAHELRTPLATLRSVCESAKAGDEPADVALERLDPIIRQAGSLVADLLLYARLDAGTAGIERQPLRLDLLAESILPEDGSITFEAEPTEVDGDPRLLAVAVRNLVANARAHGGPSDAGVRLVVRGGSITVQDRGPGLPPDVLALAGGALAIAPSRGGSGLGLAITRLIAQLHGGRLVLSNPASGGARVTLLLPVR